MSSARVAATFLFAQDVSVPQSVLKDELSESQRSEIAVSPQLAC